MIAHGVHGLRADAAHRQIHHPFEGSVVRAAGDEAQVRQGVLDFGALEEAQAPVHAIRHAGIEKSLFEHPGLRVRAVQHRRFAARAAVSHPFADAIHDEVGLVALVEGRIQLDALAVRAAGPQRLAEPAIVVRDQRVRRLENIAGGAIVLLQLVQHRLREIAAELLQVLHARAAPAIDGLVVVAHDEGQAGGTRQQHQPLVLNGVGVLELVHQHVAKTRAVVLQQRRIVAP